ncbi:MAG: hypothetical protein K2L82_16785 [Lachnospiraceae bacterium]|nr:hypothetical protein [Lachnospiraceae bacterium]
MCKIRCPLCRKRICDLIAIVEGRTVVRVRCPTAVGQSGWNGWYSPH